MRNRNCLSDFSFEIISAFMNMIAIHRFQPKSSREGTTLNLDAKRATNEERKQKRSKKKIEWSAGTAGMLVSGEHILHELQYASYPSVLPDNPSSDILSGLLASGQTAMEIGSHRLHETAAQCACNRHS